jgi:hypothetical protein
MRKIIPDTDNVEVATVAAAVFLVYRSKEHIADGLDGHLRAFKRAYKEITQTISEGRGGTGFG